MCGGQTFRSTTAALASILVVLVTAASAWASTTQRPPQHHRLLAHHTLTYTGACPLTNPRVNGRPKLRWTQHHTVMMFRSDVTFTGVAFRNASTHPVRVAARCPRTHRTVTIAHPTLAPTPPTAKTTPKPAPPHKPVVNRHVPLVAASDQPDCGTPGWDPRPLMAAHDANVYRLVGPDDSRLAVCAANIHAAGIRLYVSLRYDSRATPRAVAAQVADSLTYTGPVWAYSIGNEEDLSGIEKLPGATPAQYARDWAAAEPVLAETDPSAIRVWGEAGPWAVRNGWLAQGLARPHAGAQAVAIHCYDVRGGGLNTAAQATKIAAAYGLPSYCSEMSAATNPNLGSMWILDSPAAWTAKVQHVVNAAPRLQLTSWYRWAAIGAD